MKTNFITNIACVFFVAISSFVFGQPYHDYIGAGHHQGIKVTASSSVKGTIPENTIDGSGLNAEYMAASRFLSQATFGADRSEIERLVQLGFVDWIEDQFKQKPSLILPQMNQIFDEIRATDPDAYGPYYLHFNYAWWQTNMTNKDLLRQKVAYALSQILVVSINSDLDGKGDALASYYDIFVNRAFGNYRDILLDVAKHPAMGYYLSHLNNHKTDTIRNIRPDENFAREVMQLFSIGLFQLNIDGTRKLDANGNPIPTYDNKDIKEMAKIFTGLYGVVLPCPGVPLPPECTCYSDNNPSYCDELNDVCCWWPKRSRFGLEIYYVDGTKPLIMSEDNHEQGPKVMPDGSIIDIPGDGMAEIEAAIDFLFNHPNTGPFIAYRLIQRMVKSNPSPEYVARVARAFNDNGHGVRGDMEAVMKAILLDNEAWNANGYFEGAPGKLREPFLRYVHMCRALPKNADQDRYWYTGYYLYQAVKQHVLASPSVFNFYLPDYQPAGEITSADLVAPEFKLHNTSTAINYINLIHYGIYGSLLSSWEGQWPDNPDNVYLDLENLENICIDPESLINELDLIFMHGQLTEETKKIIHDAIDPIYYNSDSMYKHYRVRLALFLMMISPDYTCVK
ncbi:MAG: DUF1800 domain-containing protein [Chitinophagales bacterium]|nr:DUF1800 domain-containing protein [Chitinophagales bacterium]